MADEEDIDVAESDALRQIEAIKGMRFSPGTVRGYKSKNKAFIRYVASNYAQMLAGDEINLDAFRLVAFERFITEKQSKDKLSYEGCCVPLP
jgi:hypothetical protein